MSSLTQIAVAARMHADNLRDEIAKASTREEHIRLTRLALEAERLAQALAAWNGEV